ncbi:hypothetical protein N657DRAFT_342949 [Parathielavia appendiculata]|uniref:Uncharacterized protein n=1 Tax=Parathielavia appendiculata TaxID=2587402 RepID=A0AAN6U225_9PEZI|nr:hypothetical protein N657DRAFT_342949 [Parathielavia appendiculata]
MVCWLGSPSPRPPAPVPVTRRRWSPGPDVEARPPSRLGDGLGMRWFEQVSGLLRLPPLKKYWYFATASTLTAASAPNSERNGHDVSNEKQSMPASKHRCQT